MVAGTEFEVDLVAEIEVDLDPVARTGSAADLVVRIGSVVGRPEAERIVLDHTDSEADRTALGLTGLGKVALLSVVGKTVADSEYFDSVDHDLVFAHFDLGYRLLVAVG